MGIAIMSGIMAHLEDRYKGVSFLPPIRLVDNSTPSTPIEELPQNVPTRFIACVRRNQSAKRIQETLGRYQRPVTSVYINENVKAVEEADVILLGCKPQMFREILSVSGMKDALAGKLLISILAGVTVDEIEMTLY